MYIEIINYVLDEVEQYREEESRVVEWTSDKESPSDIIGLDEPIIITMLAWNTKELKSEMTEDVLFHTRKRFKISRNMGLMDPNV